MCIYIDEYGDAYRNGCYDPTLSVPTADELAREAAEEGRRPGHDFALPCGPEDFTPPAFDDTDHPF